MWPISALHLRALLTVQSSPAFLDDFYNSGVSLLLTVNISIEPNSGLILDLGTYF